MNKKQTQQFSRFFLKDLKTVPLKEGNDKSKYSQLILSDSN